MPTEPPRFVTAPPIDVLPGHVLRDFTARTRVWEAEAVAVPPPVTAFLWVLGLGSAGAAVWFGLQQFAGLSCSALPCSVATWGDRPALLFGFAAAGVLGLGVSAATTRGLTRMSTGQVVLPVMSAIAGFLSVSGLVAVAMLAALVVVTVVAGLLLLVSRY